MIFFVFGLGFQYWLLRREQAAKGTSRSLNPDELDQSAAAAAAAGSDEELAAPARESHLSKEVVMTIDETHHGKSPSDSSLGLKKDFFLGNGDKFDLLSAADDVATMSRKSLSSMKSKSGGNRRNNNPQYRLGSTSSGLSREIQQDGHEEELARRDTASTTNRTILSEGRVVVDQYNFDQQQHQQENVQIYQENGHATTSSSSSTSLSPVALEEAPKPAKSSSFFSFSLPSFGFGKKKEKEKSKDVGGDHDQFATGSSSTARHLEPEEPNVSVKIEENFQSDSDWNNNNNSNNDNHHNHHSNREAFIEESDVIDPYLVPGHEGGEASETLETEQEKKDRELALRLQYGDI